MNTKLFPTRADDDVVFDLIKLMEPYLSRDNVDDTLASLMIIMESKDNAELVRLMQKWLASI